MPWGDEAIGTYTVNSVFNELVCLLSWRYCYVWSTEKPLARSKSVKEVLTYLSLSQDLLFVLFLLPHFWQKKICINRFLCLLAFTARWGVGLQSEKSDLRFILRCPQHHSSEPWALSSEPWSQSYFGLWALSPYTMLRPCHKTMTSWVTSNVVRCSEFKAPMMLIGRRVTQYNLIKG